MEKQRGGGGREMIRKMEVWNETLLKGQGEGEGTDRKMKREEVRGKRERTANNYNLKTSRLLQLVCLWSCITITVGIFVEGNSSTADCRGQSSLTTSAFILNLVMA